MTAMPIVINDPYLNLQEDPLYNIDKARERICETSLEDKKLFTKRSQ